MNISISTLFSLDFHKGSVLKNFSYNTYELIYFQTGSGEVTIKNITKPFQANDVIFLKPNEIRTQTNFEDSYYICIRFDIIDDKLSIPSDCYSCKTDSIYNIFKEILDEYINKNIAYYDICNLKISEILFLLFRIYSGDSKNNNILSIINEIDETYNYSKSVKEMAKSVNYSYGYFRHKFKDVTGKSPIQYILDSKIEHACNLLCENKLNCTEIAYLLGFSSSSQFSKSFKKKIGISPIEYKKTNNSLEIIHYHSDKNSI